MSVSKPMSLNDFSSAGRSPFSQRLDESASGSITQARLAAAAPLAPPLAPPLASPPAVVVPRLHPANDTAASPAMSAAMAAFLVTSFMCSSLSTRELTLMTRSERLSKTFRRRGKVCIRSLRRQATGPERSGNKHEALLLDNPPGTESRSAATVSYVARTRIARRRGSASAATKDRTPRFRQAGGPARQARRPRPRALTPAPRLHNR